MDDKTETKIFDKRKIRKNFQIDDIFFEGKKTLIPLLT